MLLFFTFCVLQIVFVCSQYTNIGDGEYNNFNGGYNQPQQQQLQNGYQTSNTNLNPSSRFYNRTGNGVIVSFQLKGYSNPSSLLPNRNTCVCPIGSNCSFLKTSPRCYFQFTFLVSTADENVRYEMTEFVYLDRNGQLPMESQNSWSRNYVMQLPTKPSAIDVFAHHLGPVLAPNGQLLADDTLTHVDTFVISLTNILPSTSGVQSMLHEQNYEGRLLGTSLSLSFSITCLGQLVGSFCDMTCTRSRINMNVAQCVSVTTGYLSICDYVANAQVDRCKRCPWGVRDGTYCQDQHGNVLNPGQFGLVDSGWRATAILFILSTLGLAVLLGYVFFKRPAINTEMKIFKFLGEQVPLRGRREQAEPEPKIDELEEEMERIETPVIETIEEPYNRSHSTIV